MSLITKQIEGQIQKKLVENFTDRELRQGCGKYTLSSRRHVCSNSGRQTDFTGSLYDDKGIGREAL